MNAASFVADAAGGGRDTGQAVEAGAVVAGARVLCRASLCWDGAAGHGRGELARFAGEPAGGEEVVRAADAVRAALAGRGCRDVVVDVSGQVNVDGEHLARAGWGLAALALVRTLDAPAGAAGAGERAGGPAIRPMAAAEFEPWREDTLRRYVAGLVRAGWGKDKARRKALDELAAGLPEGLDTPGALLRVAEVRGAAAGITWLAVGPGTCAFFYDLAVAEPWRRSGVGRALVRRAEDDARAHGHDALRLHVLGHNHAAQRLFRDLEYVTERARLVARGASGSGPCRVRSSGSTGADPLGELGARRASA